MHTTNHTAEHGTGKPHHEMEGLKDWLKKVEAIVADKANEVEDSALSKAEELLNEVFTEDAAPAS